MAADSRRKARSRSGAGRLAPILEELHARVPDLRGAAADGGRTARDAEAELKALVRDAGRALRRLRSVPRSETAPLERFRAACREALNALRMQRRSADRLASALARIERSRPLSPAAGPAGPPGPSGGRRSR